MGRRELQFDPSAGPVQRFAYDLRRLREQAGRPTYRVMSTRTNVPASALAMAAGGSELPSLAVTLAYVRACGGDEADWEGRWNRVFAEMTAPLPDGLQKPIGEPAVRRGGTSPPKTRRRHHRMISVGYGAPSRVGYRRAFLEGILRALVIYPPAGQHRPDPWERLTARLHAAYDDLGAPPGDVS